MRFVLHDMTPRRASDAVIRRVKDLPDAIAWHAAREASANRVRLARLRQKHVGERCVVIGNGPSLGRMDLSPLRNEVTFGMNRIYLLFERMGFPTSYYTCVNDLVLDQYHAEIAALTMPKFLNWNSRARFSGRENLLFLRTSLPVFDFFGIDPRRPLCSGGTITFVTLQLAYYMGFKEVVLIGVDHRFVDQGTPNSTAVRDAATDENHFHPEYFPKGSRWQLPDLLRSEQAYVLARKAFERAGRRILDATVDGNCKVFEKVSYDSLFT